MAYLAIYKRYYSVEFEECSSYEDAQSFLDHGSDTGELFDVAIYDLSHKKIAWSNDDYLTKEQIQSTVEQTLKLYGA